MRVKFLIVSVNSIFTFKMILNPLLNWTFETNSLRMKKVVIICKG
jgi:hypothetical protein